MRLTAHLAVAALVVAGTAQAAPVPRRSDLIERFVNDDTPKHLLNRRQNAGQPDNPYSFLNLPQFHGANTGASPTTQLDLGGGVVQDNLNRFLTPSYKKHLNEEAQHVHDKVDATKNFFYNPLGWAKNRVTNSTWYNVAMHPWESTKNYANNRVNQVNQRIDGYEQRVHEAEYAAAHPLNFMGNKIDQKKQEVVGGIQDKVNAIGSNYNSMLAYGHQVTTKAPPSA